ncbi:MAG: LysR family transcriptional regulator [Lautropia sp.]
MHDLNALRVFVRVAETRSFIEASRRLGLTSSAVSKAISRLEHEFGVRLLNRTTRKVSLTQDGLEFFERCRQLLAELEEAETQLTQSTLAPRGRLRVHAPTGFGRRILLPALVQVVERYPDLRIDVELGERAVDAVEEGLDAVIRFGELPDSTLVARHLCEVRFIACASPVYLKRRGMPRTPADLDHHVCLGYVTPWSGRYREWLFAYQGRQLRQGISGQLNVNSAESLLDTAIAGVGIAMIADFVAYPAVASGALRVVLKNYIAPPIPVSLLYLPGKERTPRLRWFLEVLRGLIPSPTPWADIDRIR